MRLVLYGGNRHVKIGEFLDSLSDKFAKDNGIKQSTTYLGIGLSPDLALSDRQLILQVGESMDFDWHVNCC